MSSNYEDESLDPRVEGELETLNQTSLLINKLEVEIQDAKYQFNEKLSESSIRLRYLSKRLGIYIEKAQPYYDTRLKIKELSDTFQQSLDNYQREVTNRDTAKEMIMIAHLETSKRKVRLLKSESVDGWERTIEIATDKIIHADYRAAFHEEDLERSAQELESYEQHVKAQYRKLKKYVDKSRPYFEAKAKYNHEMDEHRASINELEVELQRAKNLYGSTLKNLERISNDIHDQRSSLNLSKSAREPDTDKTDHRKKEVSPSRRASIAVRKLSQHQRAGLATHNPRKQSLCTYEDSERATRKLSLSHPDNLDKLKEELKQPEPRLERTSSLQVEGEELWGCSLSAESDKELTRSGSSLTIRDEVLENAMKDTYFKGSARPTSGFDLPVIPPIDVGQEYEKLPDQLSCYQNELYQRRRSTLVTDPDLKLSSVLLLLNLDDQSEC